MSRATERQEAGPFHVGRAPGAGRRLRSARGQGRAAQKASVVPAVGAAVPERVKTAVHIARSIQAEPASMNRILEGQGMAREDFEEMPYEIATDPVLSEAYVRELGNEPR